MLAIEPLIVGAVAPGPNVTGYQVLNTPDLGDAAGAFDRSHIGPKESLTTARLDERDPFRFKNRRVVIYGYLDLAFPIFDVTLKRGRVALSLSNLATDVGYT